VTFTPADGSHGPVATAPLAHGELHALGALGMRIVTTGFHLDEGPELAWVNPYRLMAGGRLLGIGRETTPTRCEVVDGTVVTELAPTTDHPATVTMTTAVVDDTTVDTTFHVDAHEELVDYEVLVSSYFTPHQAASFRVRPWAFGDEAAWFTKTGADHEPTSWPRDNPSAQVMFDGRWSMGAPPLFWTLGSFYAEPLMTQRHRWVGLHTITMTAPATCFGISGLSGYHNSQYFHLFGTTLAAGASAEATVRLVMTSDTDLGSAALDAYDRFRTG
jgi:hypothetical protein